MSAVTDDLTTLDVSSPEAPHGSWDVATDSGVYLVRRTTAGPALVMFGDAPHVVIAVTSYPPDHADDAVGLRQTIGGPVFSVGMASRVRVYRPTAEAPDSFDFELGVVQSITEHNVSGDDRLRS